MESNNNEQRSKKRSHKLETEEYLKQKGGWPKLGNHILAQYDEESILVYQAYNKTIAQYAVENQKFSGCPQFMEKRMTWIKTNFLWMMYRSGWGTKTNQEHTLGIWLKREAFERILAKAAHTSMCESAYQNNNAWQKNLRETNVRLQWDPDHTPGGGKAANRRAIQLGMRNEKRFISGEDILEIQDLTNFVDEQYNAYKTGALDQLVTPKEVVYTVTDPKLAKHIDTSQWP